MALIPNSPIYTPFVEFINGLHLKYLTTTTVQVFNGNASDSTVTNEISIQYFDVNAAPIGVTINTAQNGLNGLDTGAVAASTLYAIVVVADSTNKHPAGAMMTLTPAAPYLPFGYDMFRYVGSVRTDGSSHILDFTQRKTGNDRDMYYAAAIATNITAGASATFAAVTVAGAPATAIEVIMEAVLTADAGGTRTVALRAHSSTSAAGQTILTAPASTVVAGSLVCPCDTLGAIDYVVSNAAAAVALNLYGYVDAL